MKLSRYCKIFPDKKDPASVLLFSTLNASKLSIPESMLTDIESGNLSKEERNTLAELGFLVKSHEQERQKMLGFMDELNSINKTLRAIVVMNLACNLSCRYCFEGTRKGKFYMGKGTAYEFVEFVKERVNTTHPCTPPKRGLKYEVTPPKRGLKKGINNLENISLTFYGGEPLLSKDMIIYISEKLKTFSESSSLKFSFNMITNGTLLNYKTAEVLKSLGMKSASITLDGPEDVHDCFRPFKTGKGSFNSIFRNIKDVSEIIDIQIGGNFTKENYREFPMLLDYLSEKKLSPERISSIRFDPVINEGEGIMPPDFHDGCNSYDEPWLEEAGLFLREEIIRRGYNTPKFTPGICMMEIKDNLLINYNGDIYKCPGLIGREEFRVGELRTGTRDFSHSHYLDNWKNEECLNCEYLPLCFGGCRYMKLVRDGNMHGVDCKKPYLDATLEKLVDQDIRYNPAPLFS